MAVDVRFVIAVEDAGAIRKLTETEQALYNLQGTTKTADSAFSNLWKGFAVGSLVVSALHKGFAALKGFVEGSISEAIESEQAQHRLAVSLEMTGRAVGNTTSDLIAFSKEQQNLTIYTDEQVQATMTLLAQLTKLDSEGIKRATKGAMGLASVLGMDLQSAALMVTKAMEGNYQALARVGIRIDENLPKEQQSAAILEKLVGLYPRATAELETMGGQLKQVGNLWGEVKESFGKALTEALDLKDSLAIVRDVLKEVTEGTDKGKQSWRDYNMQAAAARGWIAPVVYQQYEAARSAKELDVKIRGVADAFFADFFPAAEKSIVVLHKLTAETLDAKKAFEDMRAANIDVLTAFNQELPPIEDIFPVPQEFENPLQDYIDAAISGLPKATAVFKKHFKTIGEYSDEFYQDITRGFTNAFMQFSLTVKGFKNFFIGMWNAIKQAFFQILADMLAKWIAMAFVRFLIRTFALPSAGIVPAIVGGILPMQHGFQGVISRPTPILVGEAGPEYVSVTPMSRGGARGGGRTTNIYFNTYAIDAAGVDHFLRHDAYPTLKAMFAHGDL